MESWKMLWRYVAGVFGCAVIGYFPFVQQRRVPLLGGVDLGFHELGHMLTYVFPDTITALMGSMFQVAIPLGLAAYFGLRRRDLLAAGLCLAWAGASAVDVSVYIADAPFQRLPLIGGSHDWAYLLGPSVFENLNGAAGIAAAVRLTGAGFILAGVGLCFRGPFSGRAAVVRKSPMRTIVRVREPRRWVEPEMRSVRTPPATPRE
ncbi:MAG: hypothetical protein ACXW15_03565 [Acidimicrobiia bacterium]